MDLSFYEASRSLRQTPNAHYLSQKQAQINALWENGTQTSFTVLKQDEIGSAIYSPIDVSIDMAIDIGTGYKKSDDFKVFSHKDITTRHDTGILYQYADNHWITINTGDLASPISSIEVRRCNNWLRWIDKESGKIYSEPCAIDYELSSPNPQRDKDIVVSNGHCLVICQGNKDTWKIEKNQRFVFNGQPFKLGAINNLLDDDYSTTNATLLYLDLYLDTIEPDDDLQNGIANVEYDYVVTIDNDIVQQEHGFEGQLVAHTSLNGINVQRDIRWTSMNKFATIDDDGVFILSGQVGDVAKLKASLADNPDVFDIVEIEIINPISDSYEVVIEPSFTSIRQKETIVFNVSLCNNGVKQDDQVIAEIVSGDKYVTLNNTEMNEFSLTCNTPSTNPLIISFNSGDITKTVQIALKSYF